MSSSYDAGYAADQASKAKDTPCPSPKAKDGKHEWIRIQNQPAWDECKHCKEHLFWK